MNGIKDGHPFSSDESNLFEKFTEEQKQKCREWVMCFCIPAKHVNRWRTSYGLKHTLEACTGIYMTNNQFKDLMLEMQFYPEHQNELNWSYYIQEGPLKLADRFGACRRAEHVL